jgi:hypothetical protein
VLAVSVAILLAVSICYGLSTVFWHRTIDHSITIVGIHAELLQVGVDAHRDNLTATDLDGNGRICFTIYSENYYEIWLNISLTSDAPGLAFGSITGQYYHCRYASGVGYYETVGTPFSITPGTMQSIDKTKCMYGSSQLGDVLQLTFTWDTENCLVMGDFTASILFQAGFNEMP